MAAEKPSKPSKQGEGITDLQRQAVKARRALANDRDGKHGGLYNKRKGGKRTERKKPASGGGFGRAAGLNFDRRPAKSKPCGCESGLTYGECCGPCHDSGGASSPEQLLRSRYTAYAYRVPEFLMSSTEVGGPEWDENANTWKRSLLQFCDDFKFLNLKVGEKVESPEPGMTTIAFRAQLVQKGSINLMDLCETSVFVKGDGEGDEERWFYREGAVSYEAPQTD